jgi:predicted ATPase
MVVSGATGSGKTHLLRQLAASGQQVLDLEFLAKHKGKTLGFLWIDKTYLLRQLAASGQQVLYL